MVADKWLFQQHPKTLDLRFKDGLPKPEKGNVVDQFLLWDGLSEAEKGNVVDHSGFVVMCLLSSLRACLLQDLDRPGPSWVGETAPIDPATATADPLCAATSNASHGHVIAPAG